MDGSNVWRDILWEFSRADRSHPVTNSICTLKARVNINKTILRHIIISDKEKNLKRGDIKKTQ